MNLMKNLTAAAIGAMLVASPALAQNQPQVVTKFDGPTISRMLLDVQTTWEVEGDPEGRPLYRASAEGGIAFTASPRTCSPEAGCSGLLLIAVFTRNDGRKLGELDELLSRYNDLNPSGKAYRTADGTVVLQGYINAAFGISYANAQAQLLVFGQELGKLRNELTAFSDTGR